MHGDNQCSPYPAVPVVTARELEIINLVIFIAVGKVVGKLPEYIGINTAGIVTVINGYFINKSYRRIKRKSGSFGTEAAF